MKKYLILILIIHSISAAELTPGEQERRSEESAANSNPFTLCTAVSTRNESIVHSRWLDPHALKKTSSEFKRKLDTEEDPNTSTWNALPVLLPAINEHLKENKPFLPCWHNIAYPGIFLGGCLGIGLGLKYSQSLFGKLLSISSIGIFGTIINMLIKKKSVEYESNLKIYRDILNTFTYTEIKRNPTNEEKSVDGQNRLSLGHCDRYIVIDLKIKEGVYHRLHPLNRQEFYNKLSEITGKRFVEPTLQIS